MKLTVIGAGSTYTPGLILRWIDTKRDRIALDEICLYDVLPERLKIVGEFIEGMVSLDALPVKVTLTTDINEAILGSTFVILQIRVGLNKQRQIDEHMCIAHGFLGQETTGPAGFVLALRQIPPCVEIARKVQAIAPDAWLISVANPAGIVAEALINYGHPKTIGMCHGGFFPRTRLAGALGVEEEQVSFNYIGLNHLGWATEVFVDGKPLTTVELQEMAAKIYAGWNKSELALPASFGYDFCPPVALSHYVTDFYTQNELVAEARACGTTRADVVLDIERQCLDYYQREAGIEFLPPPILASRGGKLEQKRRGEYGAVGYSDGCLAIIDALLHDEAQRIIVNVLNEGSTPSLPDVATIELPAYVNRTGVQRICIGELPIEIRGLIQSVKAYETMTVDAALSGDRRKALAALLSNPMCQGRYLDTKSLLDALLISNQSYLPMFYH